MANAARSTADLITAYFSLEGQLEAEEDSAKKARILAEQRKIVPELFSEHADTKTDLNNKARILLRLLDDEKTYHFSWNSKELFFQNVLHDIITLHKNEKATPDGGYSPEAAANHYHWMFGGLPR